LVVLIINLQHPERDVLTTVYSAGNAPWDADDYMLPVITDDPLLQFGIFFSLYLHGTLAKMYCVDLTSKQSNQSKHVYTVLYVMSKSTLLKNSPQIYGKSSGSRLANLFP